MKYVIVRHLLYHNLNRKYVTNSQSDSYSGKKNIVVPSNVCHNISSDSLIYKTLQHLIMRAHNINEGDEVTKEEPRTHFNIRPH